MNLAAIITEIADELSDFLDGTTDRELARARIAERLEADHFQLTPSDRTVVTEAVMATLEASEHFDVEYVGDPFKDEPDPESDPRA